MSKESSEENESSEVYCIMGDRGLKLCSVDPSALPLGQRVIYRDPWQGELKGVVIEAHNKYGQRVVFEDYSLKNYISTGRVSSSQWTLVDGRAEADEIEKLKHGHESRVEHEREKRDEAAKIKAEETQRHIEELRAAYQWALPDDGVKSQYVRASANLKKELSIMFPGTKFSVRSDGFSMGNSVDVTWTLGPSTKEVEKIASKYHGGHFDGMEDLYHHDTSSYGEAISQVLGRTKYLNISRKYPESFYEQVGRDLCALQNREYQGLHTKHLLGEADSYDLRDHVHRLLEETSFERGAEYCGVAYRKEEEGHWVEIIQKKSQLNENQSVSITENMEKNGIEIRFSEKPEQSVLELLKAKGWRWSRSGRCWYHKQTDESRIFAYSIKESIRTYL